MQQQADNKYLGLMDALECVQYFVILLKNKGVVFKSGRLFCKAEHADRAARTAAIQEMFIKKIIIVYF